MTDPKNVPLAEARAGDIVYLKPVEIDEVNARGVTGGSFWFHIDRIDHIERPPRVLKVGEPALWFGARVKVLALYEDHAWVRTDGGYYGSPPPTDLEPVE